ncbi:MAG: hypothetical protein NWQ32_16835, partial [Paracoccaceae bacterium]|nr:hypothetical protein [Paracoccaceae bacterium]
IKVPGQDLDPARKAELVGQRLKAGRAALTGKQYDTVIENAQAALDADDPQWAMELVDRLIALDTEAPAARALKVRALRVIADETINAPTRNYYLLSAREIEEQG